MSATEKFFDTNVLLYLLSGDTAKADRAEDLLASGGVVSVQVLNEFASVASRKLKMSWLEVREVLQVVRTLCRADPLTAEVHDQGLALSERYGFSVYDSMILASALRGGCHTVLTEDLHDGQCIEDVLTVMNPFTTH